MWEVMINWTGYQKSSFGTFISERMAREQYDCEVEQHPDLDVELWSPEKLVEETHPEMYI